MPSFFSFLTTDSYQFILPIQNQHNHLGDLAGLAGLILNPFLLPIVVVVMAISFSKSAFLGFLIVLFILAIQKKGRYVTSFLVVLSLSVLIISIYTKELSSIPPIQAGQKVMKQILHLEPKPLLSIRNSYYPQVFRAWKSARLEQFLFGFGPGNYMYPSIKTGLSVDLTPAETHNVFLSIFIESGFLSFFWFLIFCIFIVAIGLRQKNSTIYLFLYLLINFQTDYTYAIPLFMGLFFFFAGQITYIKRKKPHEKIISSTILIIIFAYTIYSTGAFISLRQEKKKLDNQLTQAVINQEKTMIEKTIMALERLTPYDENELVKWSSIYEAFGNNKEAVRLLEKIALYSPRRYLFYLSHQLSLQKKNKVDLKLYLKNRKNIFNTFSFTKEEEKQLNRICFRYTKMECL